MTLLRSATNRPLCEQTAPSSTVNGTIVHFRRKLPTSVVPALSSPCISTLLLSTWPTIKLAAHVGLGPSLAIAQRESPRDAHKNTRHLQRLTNVTTFQKLSRVSIKLYRFQTIRSPPWRYTALRFRKHRLSLLNSKCELVTQCTLSPKLAGPDA